MSSADLLYKCPYNRESTVRLSTVNLTMHISYGKATWTWTLLGFHHAAANKFIAFLNC